MIEIFLDDELFEMYRLDYLFGLLIFAGVIHVLSYYVGIVLLIPKYFTIGMIIYRFGRNLAYALLPPLFASAIALLIQEHEQIELFSGELIKQSFLYSYLLFAMMGIFESIIKKGKPLCLGNIKKNRKEKL
ncbi:MAG: hypothetical protein LC437_06225 [Thiohalomonas sp.]|nr:hypothetical protein [Thiohalomonas sp.]